MAKSRLHELAERGQSVWIDFLSRGSSTAASCAA